MALIDCTGSCRSSGYDLGLFVNCPVHFVGKLGAHFALTNNGGIRIGNVVELREGCGQKTV